MANLKEVQTHAGHTVVLKLAGTIIGRAQAANARRTFGTQGVYEIGTIMPIEHIPLRYEGSVTLDKFFIRKGNVASLRTIIKSVNAGMSPGVPITDEDLILRTGLMNITVHRTEIPTAADFTGAGAGLTAATGIQRIVTQPGAILRAYLGCTLSDYTETFRANALAGENATFMFLDCLDAAESVEDTVGVTLPTSEI